MTQTSIPFPPHNGTPTSRAAAAKAATSKRLIVLAAIREHGGLTIDEISERTGLLTASICGRCAELKEMHLIRDSGRTRLTRSNRPAAVLEATQ